MAGAPVTLETLIQLDPQVWPVAVLAFLRVLTVLLFLPVFGDQNVPTRLRIGLAVLFTLFLWPVISGVAHVSDESGGKNVQWTPFVFALATMREVFFGFATGFAARMILQAASISSQLVGLNMGFQAASLFSPAHGEQESAYAVFKGWIVLMCLLSFNVHHLFLIGLTESFTTVPLGGGPNGAALAKEAISIIESSFFLGIRLAAPLLLVQLLVTLALGLLNRAIPQLNAFVMQFPLSFMVSFAVLFVTAAAFVRLLGGHGLGLEHRGMTQMSRAFHVTQPGK